MAESTAAGVDTQREEYQLRQEEWAVCRDTLSATRIYRSVASYLPAPSGFSAQPDGGTAMYLAYATRAQFPEIMGPTIEGMVGIIHRVEAQIELPPEMEYLYENVDGRGTPLEALHKRLTEEVLKVGRRILLVDAPATGGDPYIASYSAESLINWSDERDFFVLEEPRRVRDGFSWDVVDSWRVVELTPAGVTVQRYNEDKNEDGDPVLVVATGGTPLSEVPLVVVGPRSLDLDPEQPPLLGVGRCALAIFRLDADYRHQLFMTGQETAVFSGVEKTDLPAFIGAGVAVALPVGGEMKMVGPAGVGIEKHRQAIIDEEAKAAQLGSRLLDFQKRGAESGEALRIRVSSQTATLVSVALNSAAGLERALRHVATMKGVDPEEIVVKPNLSFVDSQMTPQEAKDLVTVWQSGAISYETLYENLQSGEIASMERTAEEEQDLIDEEGGGDLGDFEETELGGDDETGEVSEEELRATFAPEMFED